MTLELGTTSLSQARLARGLTLEDAEHSTRISRRFLIALEEHDYSVFPAPVYARGFLRTYCRYLGVDPEQQLAELPAGWTGTAQNTQLTPVSTRGPIAFNVKWLVAGALIVAVIGIGLFLSRSGDDLGDLQAQQQADLQSEAAGGTGTGATGSQAQPTTAPTQSSSASNGSRLLEPGLPGILPDFKDVDVDAVTEFLTQQDIAYLRIDTASAGTAKGLVISQSPVAGSDTSDIDQVTLNVSTGASPISTTRTDCDVLESTNQRTASEQTYYENNCGTTTDASPGALPDRTTCEEIRGTDYRSPAERTFFLTYCITQ